MASDAGEQRVSRVSAIELDAYLEQERARSDQRIRSGWSRAHARQNQHLPYGGTFLSPGDAALLGQALQRTAESTTATADELLGGALLSSVMTTGRSVDILADVVSGDRSDPTPPPRDTLSCDADWAWWLVPGAPSTPQLFGKMPSPVSADRSSRMPLPCSQRTRTLLVKLKANAVANPGVFPASSDDLSKALRRYVLAAGVRASARRIEGWLFQRLVLMRGGDAGTAALITGREVAISATLLHYTAMEREDVAKHLADALAGFDEVPVSQSSAAVAGRIGSRFAPTMTEMRDLVTDLAEPLHPSGKGRRRDPVAVHNAMTTYTIAFALFAAGCRPSQGLLPDEDAIDPATGFIVMDDKPTRDNFKSRIVWVADDCREQIRLNREHRRRLAERLPTIADTIVKTDQPFYLTPDLNVRPVTRAALRAELGKHRWPYPLNAGRHFLRSSLAGKVSTETLHALLGHWHIGTEAWGAASALDPLAYRADLMGHLVPLLRDAGWVPRRGL